MNPGNFEYSIRFLLLEPLFFEASLPGIDRDSAGLIAGIDGLVVVSRATGLNDRRHPFPKTHIHPVPKREGSVTDHGGPDQSAFFI